MRQTILRTLNIASIVTALGAGSVAHAQETINTRVGKLELNLGLPTKNTVEKLYDEIDFQRACQAFLWGLPAVGVSGWQSANAFYGGGGDLDLVAYKDFGPVAGILTPNTTVTYVMAFPILSRTGPLVWEIPAGQTVGIIMDFWQRPLADFGLTGPDKGSGVKLLLVGPGQKAPDDVQGYRVIQSPTVVAFMGYRILNPDPAVARKEFEKSRLYPYSQHGNPPPQKHVWAHITKTQGIKSPQFCDRYARASEISGRLPSASAASTVSVR